MQTFLVMLRNLFMLICFLLISLFLALNEKIISKFWIAESVSSNTFVLFKISKAPTDVALALIFGHPCFGLVIIKFLNPKFFNDLADAPIFSPSCGLIKIKPYLFFMNFKNFVIVGSSPEILIKLEGDKVTIRPIAGTRKRGKTKLEDKKLERDLLSDPKEIAEHLMLLDLGRNDAGKVSKINSVKVTESFIIERYSHVMHIVSNVVGEYNKKFTKFKSLLAGFPAGTVSGAPKIRAMEIIDELEKTKRKVYAGGIGYFSANGEFDTCIALRTALIKNNKFFVQAGAGIVADSKPEKEFTETVNKAKALMRAVD